MNSEIRLNSKNINETVFFNDCARSLIKIIRYTNVENYD